jgi:hypothetical protein
MFEVYELNEPMECIISSTVAITGRRILLIMNLLKTLRNDPFLPPNDPFSASKKNDAVVSSGTVFDYWGKTEADREALIKTRPFVRGVSGKFERPAFLIQNGKPTYFYGVADVNINSGRKSENVILRVVD